MDRAVINEQPRVATRAGVGGLFYVGMATAILAVALVGFGSRLFIGSPTGERALAPLVLAHATACMAWLLLLIVQPALVGSGRVGLHRRLGIGGAVLAAAVFGLGVAVSMHGVRTGWNPGGPFRTPREFLIVPLGDILLFGGFVAAALYHRRRPELHRRLMLLATLGGLLWPAITRIPPIRGNLPATLGLFALFLLAAPARDLLARRRAHPLDVWGALLVLATVPLRPALAHTDGWHAIADWLAR